VANLVTQVLEPTIGNYFRNAAQTSDVIEFLKARSQRQEEARKSISEALQEYNVNAVDTLIGDIVPPPDLMKTLTDRKIAEQQKITYDTERQAQDEKQKLEQSTALATTQKRVVDAEREVSIAEFNAKAAVAKANGDAQAKTVNAKADAEVTRVVGEATAARTLAIGEAEAAVIQKKTDAMDPEKYAMVEVAKALAGSGTKWVPEIMVLGGSEDGKGGSIRTLSWPRSSPRSRRRTRRPPRLKPRSPRTLLPLRRPLRHSLRLPTRSSRTAPSERTGPFLFHFKLAYTGYVLFREVSYAAGQVPSYAQGHAKTRRRLCRVRVLPGHPDLDHQTGDVPVGAVLRSHRARRVPAVLGLRPRLAVSPQRLHVAHQGLTTTPRPNGRGDF
jgi:regulator of protease activity HflC (stomatin/prohibitin superfamily)